MKEYDIVKSIKKISENIPKDTIGTILIVHNSDNYEIEFVDSGGNTLEVATVSKNNIVIHKVI